MKLIIILTSFAACLGLTLVSPAQQAAPEGRKAQDVYTLAPGHKLGPVTFSHLNHATKTYNISGTGPIGCVECHHTEQPAAEVAKRPPLKAAWPADRTTTLAADLFEKDANAPGVTSCRGCHAQANTKPQVWPELPQIKHEGSTAIITLTNQLAFHRNCAGCHDQAAKERPAIKAPRTTQCAGCHKRK